MQQIELGGMKPVAGCKVLQSAQRFNEQCFMHCHSQGGGEGGGGHCEKYLPTQQDRMLRNSLLVVLTPY